MTDDSRRDVPQHLDVVESRVQDGRDLREASAQEPIKTYSLEEVAAMVLPPELNNPVLWLQRRLRRGDASGYKVGHTWRMTHSDVQDLVRRHRNTPREIPDVRAVDADQEPPLGISRRSWRHHQRYPDGNSHLGPQKKL